MTTAPYRGQGKPLPAYFGGGAWVVENLIYLSTDDKETARPPAAGTMDLGGLMPTPAGTNALSFGAARIASEMGISVDELLEANRTGALRVSNRAVPPKMGDEKAMRFRFEYAGRHFEITVGLQRAGTA